LADVFISYAHSTGRQAHAAVDALRAAGYSVWIDDDLSAHRAYSQEIAEQLAAAKAALVLWSAEATRSDWVMSEANRAREAHKLVQISLDGAGLPMPFDQIQCADLAGWAGDTAHPGWLKALASLATLTGDTQPSLPPNLPAPTDAPPLPNKPSIAVLPFANLSNDPEQDYFADGMVAEIVTALSRNKYLFVIASGSSLALKGRSGTPQEAAQRLGVRYVLEGSVRKAGARVRITVSLVDAGAGEQIWSNRFEDTLDDVFALQDRVALATAGAIDPQLSAAEMARAVRRPTENMGSFDLYLRAAAALLAQTPESARQAVTYCERAIALDPNYGAAWSTLSSTLVIILTYGWCAPDDRPRHAEQARLARREALRTAGDDAAVLAASALELMDVEGDLDGAMDLVERALALNAGLAIVWMYSGIVRYRAGDIDLAAEHYEQATRLDPIGGFGQNASGFLAGARFLQGRYEEAILLSKRYIERMDGPIPYAILAACYGRLGDRSAARAALAAYEQRSPHPVEAFTKGLNPTPVHHQAWLEALALAREP